MKKENLMRVVKKTAGIAGVTCVAAGAIALVTSGTALKAAAEGFQYIGKSIRKIVKDTGKTTAVESDTDSQLKT